MRKIILLSSLLILLFSCNQEKTNEVTITGKVLTGNVEEVKFDWIRDNPIINKGEQYIAKVDSNSEFSITIPIERLAVGRIVSGWFYHDICFLPGDELYIEIEADTILFNGKGAEKNNFLYASEVNRTHDMSFYSYSNRGNLTPAQLIDSITAFKQRRLDFLETYPEKGSIESTFIDFYKLSTDVHFEYIIQSYPRRYSYMAKTDQDSLGLPGIYSKYNVLSNFIDDKKIVTPDYIPNLRNFIFTKRNEVMKADTTLNWNQAIYTILFDSLEGKTREYAIANWLCSDLSFNRFDSIAYEKFQEIEKDSLSAQTVRKAMEKYYYKQSLIGQPLCAEFAETLLEDSTRTELTFGEMMEKYKGNVVYLDIWSLNCGPCRAAMPGSRELHKRLDGLPVEFVYIAQDRPGDETWKQLFEVSMTRTNHYRMVKHDWGTSKMLKLMEINWVPCYMIFDKEGKLVDFNAERPYVSSKGESKLEKTLKELAAK
ncbi:MAG: TlpA family protein disulfide reductase [Prolixibacteraceae bacterium]|nr:TlpA family protein disulfide reductase [Prolixibacteraceae bacterium]